VREEFNAAAVDNFSLIRTVKWFKLLNDSAVCGIQNNSMYFIKLDNGQNQKLSGKCIPHSKVIWQTRKSNNRSLSAYIELRVCACVGGGGSRVISSKDKDSN